MTTITTVGYGDMSASTFLEQIICIFIMLAGVIGFAMASGALTNYIDRQDSKSESCEKKMAILEKISNDYDMSPHLYKLLRMNIESNDVEE